MAGMPIDAFPSPSTVSLIEQPPLLQSAPRLGLVWTARRSQLRPRFYELTYTGVPPETANALRLHYEQHGNATWTFIAPGIEERVRWAQGPEINWSTNRSPVIRVLLERCTAVD